MQCLQIVNQLKVPSSIILGSFLDLKFLMHAPSILNLNWVDLLFLYFHNKLVDSDQKKVMNISKIIVKIL